MVTLNLNRFKFSAQLFACIYNNYIRFAVNFKAQYKKLANHLKPLLHFSGQCQ